MYNCFYDKFDIFAFILSNRNSKADFNHEFPNKYQIAISLCLVNCDTLILTKWNLGYENNAWSLVLFSNVHFLWIEKQYSQPEFSAELQYTAKNKTFRKSRYSIFKNKFIFWTLIYIVSSNKFNFFIGFIESMNIFSY